jgi:hypothetical protein
MPADQLGPSGTLDAADVRLLGEVAVVYDAADPVPPGLVERLRFAVTLDALEAEIAQLERLDLSIAGARADEATEVQTVTFTSASLTTMITIADTGAEHVRIDGWAAPGAGVSVELRTSDGVQSTVADADGRFVFERVARGLAQFVLRPPDGDTRPAVVTPSMEL